jgi:ureidoacrylate peracid hydrolase
MISTDRTVSIQAKPAAVRVDLLKTAVLVVDMQNDFGAKGGMFDRAGVDLSVIEQAVAPIVRIIEGARSAGLPVVYVRTAHRSDLSDIGREGSRYWQMCQRLKVGSGMVAPTGEPSRLLVDGTWNTEMLPELTPLSNDIVVTKTRFSGFHATDLDEKLRELNVVSLIVVGCTTSICVESTIRDAVSLDYVCVLPADCTGQPERPGFSIGSHEATLGIIERSFGWVSSSVDILAAIR